MAPCVSAPITSSGTSCSSCAASSDRRRMNPTCGPLPCVMATSQPSLIIPAMCQQVSPAAMYWSRTVWWNLSLISEFPPIATTASLFATSAHGQRHDGLLAVQAVLGLVVDHGMWPVDDRVCHLDAPVRGKGVHVDGIRVGELHPVLVRDPVLVPVDDGRALLLVLGGHQRAPGLRVDHVAVPHALVEVVQELEADPGPPGVLLREVHDVRHQLELGW